MSRKILVNREAVKKRKLASLKDLRGLLSENPKLRSNGAILEFLEDLPSLREDFGYGFLAHTFSDRISTLRSLLAEEELSWATLFLYESAYEKEPAFKLIEEEQGAKIVVLQEAGVENFVPHKRQAILNHFSLEGKKWAISQDDDFSWRFCFWMPGLATPSSAYISHTLALRLLTKICLESPLPWVAPGSNFARLKLAGSDEILPTQEAPIFWNTFALRLKEVEENKISFIENLPIHEDICLSLDLAKVSPSITPTFFFMEGSKDFKQELLISREPATDAYGGSLFSSKVKEQNGFPTKFYSINKKNLKLWKTNNTLF